MMGVRIIIVSAVIQLVQRNSYRVLQLLLAIPWGDKSVTKKKRFVGQPKPTVLRLGYTQKKDQFPPKVTHERGVRLDLCCDSGGCEGADRWVGRIEFHCSTPSNRWPRCAKTDPVQVASSLRFRSGRSSMAHPDSVDHSSINIDEKQKKRH